MLESWKLVSMEEEGYMDTSEGIINRVAKVLSKNTNDIISTDEFRTACLSCNVDPDSFSQSDLNKLQDKLNKF